MRRRITIWRDRLGHTEDRGEHFKDDAAVQNPEEIAAECSDECDQALHRRLLEGQYDPRNGGDKADEQVKRVQEFQHLWSGVHAE